MNLKCALNQYLYEVSVVDVVFSRAAPVCAGIPAGMMARRSE